MEKPREEAGVQRGKVQEEEEAKKTEEERPVMFQGNRRGGEGGRERCHLKCTAQTAERERKTQECKVTNKNSHLRRVHSLMRKANMIDKGIKKFM